MTNLDLTHIKIKIPSEIYKKWYRNLEVDPDDFRTDMILQPETPKNTLVLNGENVYRAFKRGSYINPTATDVNREGTKAMIPNQDNKLIKTDNVISHAEYKIIINEVILTIDKKRNSVTDISSGNLLPYVAQKELCFSI